MARGGFNSQDYRMSRTKIFRRSRGFLGRAESFLGGAGGDMEGGLDNVAREVDTERFDFRKSNGRKVEIKKQF